MSASVEFSGLDELYAALRALPEEFRQQADPVVAESASRAASAVQRAYDATFQRRTGDLTKNVRAERGGPLTHVVINTAPHAHLLEYGTATRTTHGTGANRGRITGRPVFIPTVTRERLSMVERLKDVVRGLGAEVS